MFLLSADRNQQAFKFEKTSRNLKNDLYWRSIRNRAIAVTVILLIIFFIVVIICGIDFKACGSQEKKEAS